MRLADLLAAVQQQQQQQQQERHPGDTTAAAAVLAAEALVCRPTRRGRVPGGGVSCSGCEPLDPDSFLEHLKTLGWYQDQVRVCACVRKGGGGAEHELRRGVMGWGDGGEGSGVEGAGRG